MARRSQRCEHMKTARIGTTLGFGVILLAGCGTSTPGGRFNGEDADANAATADAGAPPAFEGGVDGAGAVVDAGASDATSDTNLTPASPEVDASFADQFPQVAECGLQAGAVAYRFRTVNPASDARADSPEDLPDNTAGCVGVGPGVGPALSSAGFVSVAAFGFASGQPIYVRQPTAALPAPERPDGTIERPYPTLAQGLNHTPRARTIIVAAGGYTMPDGPATGFEVASELSILGAGGSGAAPTTITVAANRGAFNLRQSSASLSIANVRLVAGSDEAPGRGQPLVRVAGGAAFFASSADLVGGDDGVRVEGTWSTASLDHVRVGGTENTSVRAVDGASIVLRQSLLASGALAGALADGGFVSATESVALGPTGEGLVYTGALAPGANADRLDRVIVRRSRGVGLRAEGANRRVAASFIEVTGTAAATTAPVVGVFVADGAELSIDDGFERQNDGRTDPERLVGSLVGGNFGTAVLATGTGTTLRLNGARIERNGGPGVVVQLAASAPQLDLLTVDSNLGVGIMATSGASIVGLLDNTVRDTQFARVGLLDNTVMPVSVGILLADVRSVSPVALLDNTVRGALDSILGVVLSTTIELKDISLSHPGRFYSDDIRRVSGNGGSMVSLLDNTVVPSAFTSGSRGVVVSPTRFVSR